MVIMSAVGGEPITTAVEGRERYTINVRYARELRDDLDKQPAGTPITEIRPNLAKGAYRLPGNTCHRAGPNSRIRLVPSVALDWLPSQMGRGCRVLPRRPHARRGRGHRDSAPL
jgi:hypothetical protein